MTFKACLEQMLLPFAFPLPFLSVGDLWFSQFLERLLITGGYLRNLNTYIYINVSSMKYNSLKISVLQMIFAKFLMYKWQNIRLRQKGSANITVKAACQRRKSW